MAVEWPIFQSALYVYVYYTYADCIYIDLSWSENPWLTMTCSFSCSCVMTAINKRLKEVVFMNLI